MKYLSNAFDNCLVVMPNSSFSLMLSGVDQSDLEDVIILQINNVSYFLVDF